MPFSLVTEEFDFMAGPFHSAESDMTHPLQAETFEEAVKEAQLLFQAMERYNPPSKRWGESGLDKTKQYPRNPRLMVEL